MDKMCDVDVEEIYIKPSLGKGLDRSLLQKTDFYPDLFLKWAIYKIPLVFFSTFKIKRHLTSNFKSTDNIESISIGTLSHSPIARTILVISTW